MPRHNLMGIYIYKLLKIINKCFGGNKLEFIAP